MPTECTRGVVALGVEAGVNVGSCFDGHNGTTSRGVVLRSPVPAKATSDLARGPSAPSSTREAPGDARVPNAWADFGDSGGVRASGITPSAGLSFKAGALVPASAPPIAR